MPRESVFEIIIVGEGANHHLEKMSSELPIEFEYDKKKYKVTSSDLFLKPRTPKDILARVPHRFLSIFKEGSESAFGLESKGSKITGELLCIAESSQSMKGALKSLLKESMGLDIGIKKILFIGVVVIVVSVAFLSYIGIIDLGTMLG